MELKNWSGEKDYTSPLEMASAELAGLTLTEYRKLHGNTKNKWNKKAIAVYKADKVAWKAKYLR